MAEENKPVEVKGTSPKGVFKYPHLIEPDYGTKEFPKKEGEYNSRLVLDKAGTEAFLKQLKPVIDYAAEQGAKDFAELKLAVRKKLGELTINDVAEELYDPDTEEPTGMYEFRFKTKASGVSKGKKWTRTMPLFDAKGNPIKKIDAVWGGTEGKLSYVARYYFVNGSGVAGVTLYLEAAQIINLVAAGQRDAGGYGFEEEEGYEADNSEAPFDEEEGSYEGDEDDAGDDDDF